MKQTKFGLDLYLSGNVKFQYFDDGKLWYKTTAGSFVFPIPIGINDTRFFNSIENALSMKTFIEDWYNKDR